MVSENGVLEARWQVAILADLLPNLAGFSHC